jgi:hypothetical protein
MEHAHLLKLLDYHPDTGKFFWRVNRNSFGGKVKVGVEAGTNATNDGQRFYREITVDRKRYKAHRLAWFYVHGKWPPHHIDHINGDGLDNRINNLRLATNSQNAANNRRKKAAASGLKGAYKATTGPLWFSHIYVGGKKIYLGSYPTAEEAHMAYAEAAKRYHGEFARV